MSQSLYIFMKPKPGSGLAKPVKAFEYCSFEDLYSLYIEHCDVAWGEPSSEEVEKAEAEDRDPRYNYSDLDDYGFEKVSEDLNERIKGLKRDIRDDYKDIARANKTGARLAKSYFDEKSRHIACCEELIQELSEVLAEHHMVWRLSNTIKRDDSPFECLCAHVL